MTRSVRSSKGFTLIEVLLVMTILVVIAGLAIGGYGVWQKRADIQATEAKVKQAASQVDLYKTIMKDYPSGDVGLSALVTLPDDAELAGQWLDGTRTFFKEGKVPTDAWGMELMYERLEGDTGAPFRVYSPGPDKIPGNEDDISSVKSEG